ncbi:putative porin [Aureitalea marina]|uniref:Porin n=1 Tax=Aureitalea marina TaxID=930804 RepID=A0A2S7KNC2_9FLAO|nr:putative porin [Aureitalea marina]PQB04090.1 hypothetical protein BST85_03625 [Aureitalea marina]
MSILRALLLALSLLFPVMALAQTDSTQQKFTWTGDFRFRVEPDWDSRKSDGSYRDNRTRLRYRVRFGGTYHLDSNWEIGARLRTGFGRKQQDPQLTLGYAFNEFGTLPIFLEKAYGQYVTGGIRIWAGKNTFPFEKQNELFWSDHVYPEGVALRGMWPVSGNWIDELGGNTGHFIAIFNNGGLDEDSYFQGIQAVSKHWNKRLTLFPGFYYFHALPDIPDGGGTYTVDYSILHLGGRVDLLEKPIVGVELDYYHNLQEYTKNDSIPNNLQDQRTGWVISARVGKLKKKGDWKFRITLQELERFSAVDYFAQNDWARWDYSFADSPDGRLTNYRGLELMAGYMISDQIKVNTRYFAVEQLVPYGPFLETGQRIRFDIDIGF